MLDEETRQEVMRRSWFHSIDFGDGVISPGVAPYARLKSTANHFFSEPIAGKTVLDINCWDGFYSIEAARLGAKHVLATDYYIWNIGGSDRGNFELARKMLAPEIEVKEVDTLDISPETVGMHDVVIFSGVLYHMRHPLLALEKAATVCKEMIIVETHLDAENEARPAMIMYPGTELNNDFTNWWGPNKPCVEAMLKDLGFHWIKFTRNPGGDTPTRGLFHGSRSTR